MSSTQKTALNVVLGARVDQVEDVEAALDLFVKHGHREVDTARIYARGTCEEILAKANWERKGLLIETKILPLYPRLPEVTGAHSLEDMRKTLMASLKALNTNKLDIWYLHAPDRSVPYEETLKAIDELYREGHFNRWGLSHYMAWEVVEIVGICKQNGYVPPSVYQGIYNAINRDVEAELFPALRKFGIAFYEFNPLAGGLLTDRYSTMDANVEGGSRFDSQGMAGQAYRARYWKPVFFDALKEVRAVAAAHGLTMAEVGFRWVSHSSFLRREHGDAVIIGGSSVKQIEENLVSLEKGPLPADVLTALDAAWAAVKGESSTYYKPW
ncbi:Aflatoxin B1 aldehyde reductase member 3 [Mycena sanguinolenta]|uniref:Aflatoxin B1 aldehyde reductase member 3 n=1 Tax=Mycena sanguinolenta TaxID=230812 RepID=A0A8H6Z5Y4_9AGAR|nr:Aflatoxin B1 aldehyde reductase member 3 [Mycena sanguinolenta]